MCYCVRAFSQVVDSSMGGVFHCHFTTLFRASFWGMGYLLFFINNVCEQALEQALPDRLIVPYQTHQYLLWKRPRNGEREVHHSHSERWSAEQWRKPSLQRNPDFAAASGWLSAWGKWEQGVLWWGKSCSIQIYPLLPFPCWCFLEVLGGKAVSCKVPLKVTVLFLCPTLDDHQQRQGDQEESFPRP